LPHGEHGLVLVGDHHVQVQRSAPKSGWEDISLLGQNAMKELKLQHYGIYDNNTGTVWFTKSEHRGYHVMVNPRLHGAVHLVRHRDGSYINIDDEELKVLEIVRM
jgi:hypothetical protein